MFSCVWEDQVARRGCQSSCQTDKHKLITMQQLNQPSVTHSLMYQCTQHANSSHERMYIHTQMHNQMRTPHKHTLHFGCSLNCQREKGSRHAVVIVSSLLAFECWLLRDVSDAAVCFNNKWPASVCARKSPEYSPKGLSYPSGLFLFFLGLDCTDAASICVEVLFNSDGFCG